MKRLSQDASSGFALIVTLIMVVLAAVMVIALLSNTTLERTTATSYANRFNAELAVQNGLEAAKKALSAPATATTLTQDDTFLVARVDGPATAVLPNPAPNATPSYYYLAKPRAGNANLIDYYPLFAGGNAVPGQIIDLSATATRAVATPTPPPNPAATDILAAIQTDRAKTKITKAYPEVGPWIAPPNTKWVEVADPSDTGSVGNHRLPYQRYTFWVEDLAGYVDASVAGNIANGGANKRPLDQSTLAKRYTTTPSELALFTLFDPSNAPVDPGNTGAELLVGNRALQLTTRTLKQVAPALATPDLLSPNVAVRPIPDSEQALVPFGYGYVDEGNPAKARVDLAAQLQAGGDPAVQEIARKINDNLPNFGSVRKGGLPESINYVNTIAASILDYADTDSDATVGSDYRGIDSYPFVSELYTMKWWKRTYQNAGTYWVEVQMDTWVELWNPSDQTISGTAALDILESHQVQAGNYSYTFGTTPADLPNGSTVSSIPSGVAPLAVSNMKPNEYAVFKVRTDTFQLNTGVSPPLIFPAQGVTTMPLSDAHKSNYKLSWNGRLVDTAGSNAAEHIQRLAGSLKGPPSYVPSNKNWRGTSAAFGYVKPTTSGGISDYSTMGDPRASLLINAAQVAIAYDLGSSFWGRNSRSNVPASAIYAAVRPAAWPDSAHNTTYVGAAPGSGSVADPPATRPSAATTESSRAPGTISNAGSYSSLAEFGNIYDPGLWNIPPDTAAPPTWSNIAISDITTANQSDANYGGGMTLHIGRQEFTLFDKPGTRAWQLLDLFSTGPRVNTAGLVNINTASREALRALGANVLLNRDPDKLPAGTLYPPYATKQADQFADAVITGRPFLSAAQLSSLKIPGTPPLKAFFGNKAAWTNQPAPTEWNDSGTEEYFAKVFPLASVRSRNFRVFVTGQSLDKNNNVLSTVSKVFQVHLNPTRDPTGKITSQNVISTYEAQLPL